MSISQKLTDAMSAAPVPRANVVAPARQRIHGFDALSDLASDWATSTGAASRFYKRTAREELALVGAWEWDSFYDGMRVFLDFLGPEMKAEHAPSREGADRYIIDFVLLAERGTEQTELILHTAYVREEIATDRMAGHVR